MYVLSTYLIDTDSTSTYCWVTIPPPVGGWSTILDYTMYARCMDIVIWGSSVRRYVGFHPLKTNRGKTRRRPDLGKNFEENLEKHSSYHLLMFTWDQGLHCIGSQIIVELVDMQESFIWLPTIAWLTESCSTDLEFHRALARWLIPQWTLARSAERLSVKMSWQGHNWRVVGYVCVSKLFYHYPDPRWRRSCGSSPALGMDLYVVKGACHCDRLDVKSTYELIGYSVTVGSYSTKAWWSVFDCLSRATLMSVCSAAIFTHPSYPMCNTCCDMSICFDRLMELIN